MRRSTVSMIFYSVDDCTLGDIILINIILSLLLCYIPEQGVPPDPRTMEILVVRRSCQTCQTCQTPDFVTPMAGYSRILNIISIKHPTYPILCLYFSYSPPPGGHSLPSIHWTVGLAILRQSHRRPEILQPRRIRRSVPASQGLDRAGATHLRNLPLIHY